MIEKGSSIAAEIIADMKREEIFKKKYKRKESCLVYDKKQCDNCNYIQYCEDKE